MKNLFLGLFLMLSFAPSQAQSQQELGEMKNRLEKLENMEKLRDKDLELKKTELISFAKEEVRASKEEITDGFGLLAKLGLPLTVGGLIVLFISSWLYINKKHRDFIDRLSSGKQTAFNKAIALQEFENKVKAEKNILVLSTEIKKEEQINTLLFQLGFKDPTRTIYKTVEKFELPDKPQHFDLIIFNDIEKSFSTKGELMKDYWSKCSTKQIFLAYTTGQGQIPTHPQMNLANSQFTLYQQILNSIRVGELLNE